jgi:hypothetical protein
MAKEIYKKLLALQQAVVGLTKDKNGNSYQYISGDKILGIVRPKMDELGILLTIDVLEANYARQDYATKSGQKTEMFCTLRLRFTWIDTASGDTLPVEWASSGMNGFDKGLGSALTYAERYFILKQLHIATDKDDVDAPKSAEEEMNLAQIIAQINSFTTQEQMTWAWQTYAYYHKDREFKAAFAKRQKEISDGTAR